MKIMSCVGGHPVNVIANAVFDPAIRKYKGGHCVLSIPYSGTMLSARAKQSPADPIMAEGIMIATQTPQIWESVDELPGGADYYIVSAMYVAGCKALGRDTSQLLTMGGTVVDDTGRTVGVTGFNRN